MNPLDLCGHACSINILYLAFLAPQVTDSITLDSYSKLHVHWQEPLDEQQV